MRNFVTAVPVIVALVLGSAVAEPPSAAPQAQAAAVAAVDPLAAVGPVAAVAAPDRTGDASDVVVAAVDVSRHTFADGEARYAVVGRDDVFADNLAGAALAGAGGPLLYTTPGAATLRSETQQEIQRVLGPAGAGCGQGAPVVYLLGGAAAISATAEEHVRAQGYCVQRFAGASRVETSLAVARHLRTSGSAGQVLLARSDDWADAATGGAYAAVAGAPIVVTPRDALHPAVAAFLAERPGDRVVLLGGAAALSEGVRSHAARTVARVDRVSGAARDETAAAIARGLWRAHAPAGAVLVNGYDAHGWAYALSGAVLAARTGAPQLYVTSQRLTAGTTTYLQGARPRTITVVGPPSQIGEGVRAEALAVAAAAAPSEDESLLPWAGPTPDASLYSFIGGPAGPHPLPSCTIPYVINPDGAPVHAQADVEEALRRISAVSGLAFRFDGFRTDDRPTWEMKERRQPGYLGYDGHAPLLIAYGSAEQFPILSGASDGVVGFGGPVVVRDADGTKVWASGQVVLGTEFAAAAPGGFARHHHHGIILLHELGHAIGLAHPVDDGQMMSGVTSRTTFGDGDRYALTTLGATCAGAT